MPSHKAEEPGDLVGLGVDVDLTKDDSAAVVDRGQQVPGVPPATA